MTKRHSRIIPTLVVTATGVALLAGCKGEPPATNAAATKPAAHADSAGRLPTTRMSVGGETFVLEVAYRAEDQEVGLMNRREMAANHGMIFVNNVERNLSFWMKNTLIPLDIVFLDRTGRVVSVKTMKALDETPVPSDGPAMYAIELNAGAASRAGVKPGDLLKVPDELRVP